MGKKSAMIGMSIFTGLTVTGWIACKLTIGGTCPQPDTDPNFDVKKYYGRWYELVRDPNTYQDGECTTAQYYELPGNYVSVNNHEYYIHDDSQNRPFEDFGSFFAECSTMRAGQCGVSPIRPLVPFSPYSVVAIDHEAYSVIYSCTNWIGGAYILEDLWVLTRDAIALNTPEWNSMYDKVTALISERLPFFDQNRLIPTQQTEAEGCKYAPTVDQLLEWEASTQ